MRVGCAQVDVTPHPASGWELSGFVARVQPSLGVHDPLFVRALHVAAGGRQLLWLHADLLGFERGFVADLKSRLRAGLGLQPHEVVVSATHTHSAPATVPLVHCGRPDPRYLDFLEERVLHAAATAVDTGVEVEAICAEGRCDLAIDRRGKSSRHTDVRAGAVAWRRHDGSFAAVLANYPIHHVAMGPENRLISADMAGQAARHVATHLPGAPLVLFTNGGCGNLNPPAVGNDFARMQRWGDALGAAVVEALAPAPPALGAGLCSALHAVPVAFRQLDERAVDEIAERQRGHVFGRTDDVSARCRDALQRWAERMKGLIRSDSFPRQEPMDVQVVRLGPVTFVCLGGEPFSLLADELRAITGRAVYVVGYANGLLGYLPPRAAYEEGGYEVEGASIFYDRPPFAPGAHESARDGAVELIRGLA